MTHDEARVLLVEQGAKVLAAQFKLWEAKQELSEALQPLIPLEESGLISEFTVDEQEDCFHQSCALIGKPPQHPSFARQRDVFAQRRGSELEQRLDQQREQASMN